MTKLIVGLGNPGSEYEKTRHNLGFLAVDYLARKIDAGSFSEKKSFSAWLAEGKIADEKIILAKPMTFMNLSGEAVAKIANYYKLSGQDLVVIYDDIDLPVGQCRIRLDDQSSTHNGVKSVVEHCPENRFIRVRIGIYQPEQKIPIDRFVLADFPPVERKKVDQLIELVIDQLILMIKSRKIVARTITLCD